MPLHMIWLYSFMGFRDKKGGRTEWTGLDDYPPASKIKDRGDHGQGTKDTFWGPKKGSTRFFIGGTK